MHYLNEPLYCQLCVICSLPCAVSAKKCEFCKENIHSQCYNKPSHICLDMSNCACCRVTNTFLHLNIESTDFKMKNEIVVESKHKKFFDAFIVDCQKFEKTIDINDILKQAEQIYTFDKVISIKNRSDTSDVVLYDIITDTVCFTWINGKLFTAMRCLICDQGFHITKKNQSFCDACAKCIICGKEKSKKTKNTKNYLELSQTKRQTSIVSDINYNKTCTELQKDIKDKNLELENQNIKKKDSRIGRQQRDSKEAESINVDMDEGIEFFRVYKTTNVKDNELKNSNFLYCIECFNMKVSKDEICPICMKSYTNYDMVSCDICYRWIHYACVGNSRFDKKEAFSCIVCKNIDNFSKNNTMDVNYHLPKCYYCKNKTYDFYAMGLDIVQISEIPSYFAHRICAYKNISQIKDQNTIILKRTGQHGQKLICIFGLLNNSKAGHNNCAEPISFVSNYNLPLCKSHLIDEKSHKNNLNIRFSNSKFILADFDNSDSRKLHFSIRLIDLKQQTINDKMIKSNTRNTRSADTKISQNKHNFTDHIVKTIKFVRTKDFLLYINGETDIIIFKNNIPTIIHFDNNKMSIGRNVVSIEEAEEIIWSQKNPLSLDSVFEDMDRFHTKFLHRSLIPKIKYNKCAELRFQINNLTSSYINVMLDKIGYYIDESNIHGSGLFAKRFYVPHEPILSYDGEIISSKEADEREPNYLKKGCDFYMFEGLDQIITDATFIGGFGKFMNQSCEPNCYSSKACWGVKTGIIICAARHIMVGEELTYIYDLKGGLICSCKMKNCLSNQKF